MARVVTNQPLDCSNGTVQPLPTAATFRLANITIRFAAGKLSAVIGPSGCGKTTLMYAILGELQLDTGTVALAWTRIRGAVATVLCNACQYVPHCIVGCPRRGVLCCVPMDCHWRDDCCEHRARQRVRCSTVGVAKSAEAACVVSRLCSQLRYGHSHVWLVLRVAVVGAA